MAEQNYKIACAKAELEAHDKRHKELAAALFNAKSQIKDQREAFDEEKLRCAVWESKIKARLASIEKIGQATLGRKSN